MFTTILTAAAVTSMIFSIVFAVRANRDHRNLIHRTLTILGELSSTVEDSVQRVIDEAENMSKIDDATKAVFARKYYLRKIRSNGEIFYKLVPPEVTRHDRAQ